MKVKGQPESFGIDSLAVFQPLPFRAQPVLSNQTQGSVQAVP
jgi:hypothetical protein